MIRRGVQRFRELEHHVQRGELNVLDITRTFVDKLMSIKRHATLVEEL